MFSSSSTSATTQRESFDDIAEPVAGNARKDEKKINGSVSLAVTEHESRRKDKKEEASLQRKERKEKDDGTKKLPNEREKDNQGQE
ncbi:hypothetical protein OIU78_013129 [Salix suchowensis]|nr:hypothetical protein OIU78_013129 [Salix suchowensis]